MRLLKMFPKYITFSPQCWFGHHWTKWDAYDDDHVLRPYGVCWTCGKEKFWKDTNLEKSSNSSLESQALLKGSQMDQIWEITNVNHQGLPVVVVANELLEFIRDSDEDISRIELDEFIDLFDEWIAEGVN